MYDGTPKQSTNNKPYLTHTHTHTHKSTDNKPYLEGVHKLAVIRVLEVTQECFNLGNGRRGSC